MYKYPKISVVTISLNEKQRIQQTIESVLSQSYKSKEYIIIDGGSTDGTLEVIKKYHSHISYLQTGADSGIYDAMNQGVKKSTGEFILFLNAGDSLIEKDTLKKMIHFATSNTQIIYGHCIVVYRSFEKRQYCLPLVKLNRRMIFSHQSALVHRSLLEANPFNLEYSIASDFNFFYFQKKAGVQFFNTNLWVCRFHADGISHQRAVKAYLQNLAILKKGGEGISIYWYYGFLIAYQYVLKIIKHIFGTKFFDYLMNWKYKLVNLVKPE